MSKKKSKKSSGSTLHNNELLETKSSFLEIQEFDKSTVSAELAPVFNSEELSELKASVEAFDDEKSEVKSNINYKLNEFDFLESEEPQSGSALFTPGQLKSSHFVSSPLESNQLGSNPEESNNNNLASSLSNLNDLVQSESIDHILEPKEDSALNDFIENEIDDEDSMSLNTTFEPKETLQDLIEGSELEGFDSASIEEIEFIEETRLESIIESILFATDRPVSVQTLKQIFKGTNVTNARLKKAIETLQVEYAGGRRGVTLEEVGSGYQLRTKVDNMEFLRKSFKAKSFKLSGPALEVLAITAYKQPIVKAEIDEIRGVESGHLLRALMEKNLVLFAGKSDLPGKPMQYATTRKFLEIFGLRNLKELPTLSQIDELLPDGIGDEEEKPKLADITDGLAEKTGHSYSEGEEELLKISDQLDKIDTSSEFFEKEKLRQKQEREAEKARNIQEALSVGEEVSNRDRNWLKRYEEHLSLKENQIFDQANLAINELKNRVLEKDADAMISDANAETESESEAEAEFESDTETYSIIGDFEVLGESEADQELSSQDSEDLSERFESNDIPCIDDETTNHD